MFPPAAEKITRFAAAKSKKKRIVGALAGLALASGGAAFWWWSLPLQKVSDARAERVAATPSAPPVYLPMDNMVVNLAGQDGQRIAQVGISLQLADSKARELVKLHMPAIYSGVLLAIARHTAQELLLPEGKELLALEIGRQVLLPLGINPDEFNPTPPAASAGRAKAAKLLQSVLFSSLIIQ